MEKLKNTKTQIDNMVEEINKKKYITPNEWKQYAKKLKELFLQGEEKEKIKAILKDKIVICKKEGVWKVQKIPISLKNIMDMEDIEQLRVEYFLLPDGQLQTPNQKEKKAQLQKAFDTIKETREITLEEKVLPLKTASQYNKHLEEILQMLQQESKRVLIRSGSINKKMKKLASILIVLVNDERVPRKLAESIKENYKNIIHELYILQVKDKETIRYEMNMALATVEKKLPPFNLIPEEETLIKKDEEGILKFTRSSLAYIAIRYFECSKQNEIMERETMMKKYEKAYRYIARRNTVYARVIGNDKEKSSELKDAVAYLEDKEKWEKHNKCKQEEIKLKKELRESWEEKNI